MEVNCLGIRGVKNERKKCSNSMEEVRSALRRMKYGKAARLDEIAAEFLTKGEEALREGIKRILIHL